MLDNYDRYSLNTSEKYLKSEVIMPTIVENIKSIYKKLMRKKALITEFQVKMVLIYLNYC